MDRTFAALLILLGSAAGCSEPRTVSTDGKWQAPAGACIFMSNRADRVYCGITGTQLLANPSLYDGKLVIVAGWVSGDERQLSMFLTREALDAGAGLGTVAIEGAALQELGPGLSRLTTMDRVMPERVAGRFLLREKHPQYRWESNRLSSKLGIITEASTRW